MHSEFPDASLFGISADIDPLGRVGASATLSGSIDIGAQTLSSPDHDRFVISLRGRDGALVGANLIERHTTGGSFLNAGRIAAGINAVWALGGAFDGQASFDGKVLTSADPVGEILPPLDSFVLRLRPL